MKLDTINKYKYLEEMNHNKNNLMGQITQSDFRIKVPSNACHNHKQELHGHADEGNEETRQPMPYPSLGNIEKVNLILYPQENPDHANTYTKTSTIHRRMVARCGNSQSEKPNNNGRRKLNKKRRNTQRNHTGPIHASGHRKINFYRNQRYTLTNETIKCP